MASALVPQLSSALLDGSYQPGLVRRKWIPKAGGGQRGLGIPNVIDRLVQQAVHRVLEPHYERASMGMQKYENIVECPTEEAFLERTAGRPLLGVERDTATTSLWEVEMPDDLVFVLGSEDDGIPASLLDRCASVFAIPMYGINHSFPVAICAGMVMCEWARRRDPRARSTPPYRGEPLV